VKQHHVPALVCDVSKLQGIDWDLALHSVIPQVDGVRTVKAVALASDVDLDCCLRCLNALLWHKGVVLLDIFQFANMYLLRPNAQRLFAAESAAAEEASAEAANDAAAGKGTGGEGAVAEWDSDVLDWVAGAPRRRKRATQKGRATPPHLESPEGDPKGASKGSSKGSLKGGSRWDSNEKRSKSPSTQARGDRPHLEFGCGPLLSEAAAFAQVDKGAPSRKKRLGARDVLGFLVALGEGKSLREVLLSDKSGRFGTDRLDHRRLVAFGTLHGLLQRVHAFPVCDCPRPELVSLVNALHGATRKGTRDVPPLLPGVLPLPLPLPAGGGRALGTKRLLALVDAMNGRACLDEIQTRFLVTAREVFDLIDGLNTAAAAASQPPPIYVLYA